MIKLKQIDNIKDYEEVQSYIISLLNKLSLTEEDENVIFILELLIEDYKKRTSTWGIEDIIDTIPITKLKPGMYLLSSNAESIQQVKKVEKVEDKYHVYLGIEHPWIYDAESFVDVIERIGFK